MLLLSELKVDRHDQLHGDRSIVQIGRFILPLLQRIKCGLVQEGMSGDDLHLYDVPLLIQNCIDLHLALNMCFSREWRIFRQHLYDHFRLSHMSANTHRSFRFNRWRRGNGPRRSIQHSSNYATEHASQLPRVTAGHSSGYSTETIVRQRWFLDLRDVFRDHRWCEEFPCIHERVVHNFRLDDFAGRRRGGGGGGGGATRITDAYCLMLEDRKIKTRRGLGPAMTPTCSNTATATTQRSRTSLHVVFFEKNGL